MLVGNKCDEQSLREVSEAEGKAESVSWGVSYMETSAKNNVNVTELFQVNNKLDEMHYANNNIQLILFAGIAKHGKNA